MQKAILPIIIFVTTLIIIIVVLLFLPAKEKVNSSKLKVAATIFPAYDITRKIGGDKIEVLRVLPAGASSHTFEPTPAKIKELQGARIVFTIGGIDDWIDGVIKTIGAEKVILSDGINIKNYSVAVIGEAEEGGSDPHYWMTIPNAKVIAKNIAGKLSEIDPRNATYYSSNLQKFERDADSADSDIRDILKNVRGKSLIAFHGAWNYFAEEYGLNIAASFEPFPGKEPSAAHLRSLSDLVKREGIKSIFSEPSFSDESLKAFMSDLGLKLYVLYPEDSSSGGESYIETMIINAKTIAKGLSLN